MTTWRARAAEAPTTDRGTDRLMQVLRRGATGSAVAEVRRVLATLGLLDNTAPDSHGRLRRGGRDWRSGYFQQHRGLFVDGVVGPETYAALGSARWKLGDRVLAHYPGALLAGDDVADLQTQADGTRLPAQPSRSPLRHRHRAGRAQLPARVRAAGRRRLRAGHACARCCSSSARRVVGGQPAAAARHRRDRRRRPEAARQAGRHRSGQRRDRLRVSSSTASARPT